MINKSTLFIKIFTSLTDSSFKCTILEDFFSFFSNSQSTKCALVINIDNSRAVRVRGIVTGVSGQTMTSMGRYEAVVYRVGGGSGSESKRFAVLVDSNASPGNGQGIKMDVIGDTLYIQNKSGMSYAQSITAWAEIFYA